MYNYSPLQLNFWAEGNIFAATTLTISHSYTSAHARNHIYLDTFVEQQRMVTLNKNCKHKWNLCTTDDSFVDISKNIAFSKSRLKRFKEWRLHLVTS